MPARSAGDRALVLLARIVKAANKAKKQIFVSTFIDKSPDLKALLGPSCLTS